jgi:predicted esterase
MSSLVVFLHGSGSSGLEMRQFLQLFPFSRGNTFLKEMKKLNADVVCPTSHSIPYSPLLKEPSNVWFDRSLEFTTLGRDDPYEDESNIERSAMSLRDFIHEQERLRTYDHIYIGGMSMGGGMSLHLLKYLSDDPRILDRLRGIFVVSSYLINQSRFFRGSTLSSIPILMLHGRMDSLIRYEWGESSANDIKASGYDLDFKPYNHADHELTADMVSDSLLFFQATFTNLRAHS